MREGAAVLYHVLFLIASFVHVPSHTTACTYHGFMLVVPLSERDVLYKIHPAFPSAPSIRRLADRLRSVPNSTIILPTSVLSP